MDIYEGSPQQASNPIKLGDMWLNGDLIRRRRHSSCNPSDKSHSELASVPKFEKIFITMRVICRYVPVILES